MDVKNEEKPQESPEKKVIEDKPKEQEPIKEQPVKETKCSIICGEVNYII